MTVPLQESILEAEKKNSIKVKIKHDQPKRKEDRK